MKFDFVSYDLKDEPDFEFDEWNHVVDRLPKILKGTAFLGTVSFSATPAVEKSELITIPIVYRPGDGERYERTQSHPHLTHRNFQMELGADRYAAEHTSTGEMIRALETLASWHTSRKPTDIGYVEVRVRAAILGSLDSKEWLRTNGINKAKFRQMVEEFNEANRRKYDH